MKKKNPEQQETEFWQSSIETVKARGAEYRYGSAGALGLKTIEAYLPDTSFPIGMLYYRQVSRYSFSISLLMVYPAFRRIGVATGLIKQLFAVYPEVKQFITARGSTTGGANWLKATGWEENDLLGWTVTREQFGK